MSHYKAELAFGIRLTRARVWQPARALHDRYFDLSDERKEMRAKRENLTANFAQKHQSKMETAAE